MVNFRILDEKTLKLSVSIPRPVLLWNSNLKFSYWKDCFMQKKNEANTIDDKLRYETCRKILMAAELCDATITYVGNSNDDLLGITFNFTFKFPTPDCLEIFIQVFENLSMLIPA